MPYLDLMIIILKILLSSELCFIKSRHQLELELILLRQQLNILKRKTKNPKLVNSDRVFISVIAKFLTNWKKSITIVKPQTVINWHRKGFRLFWRWKSRRKLGRPGINTEIRKLIRDMSLANTLWGAPRIHGELLNLGIDVSQATVRRYMVKHRNLPHKRGGLFWITTLKILFLLISLSFQPQALSSSMYLLF
jgi:putative transposase